MDTATTAGQQEWAHSCRPGLGCCGANQPARDFVMTDGEEITDADPSDDCKSMCKALQELHFNDSGYSGYGASPAGGGINGHHNLKSDVGLISSTGRAAPMAPGKPKRTIIARIAAALYCSKVRRRQNSAVAQPSPMRRQR